MLKKHIENDYQIFFVEIKKRIKEAQYSALKRVNKELILLYWDIGKKIVKKQAELGWGRSIVENLAKDLQKEFAGIKGFSSQNLWYMRQFYIEYRNDIKLQLLVGEISWAKNLIILGKCKDALEREFYIKMTKRLGWTKDVLINHIENKYYERYLLNQTNFDKTIPARYQEQAKLAVKDEYTFEFLELSEEHSEKELENALIGKMKGFLSEMGSYFCFVGSQYRLEVDDDEYFIDLLLYNRMLRSLVAIELKIGKFKPEYSGKMQFYLSALDDTFRIPGENPSIGIIVCKEKTKTTVEYALRDAKRPIGVATYKITPSLPTGLKRYLPSKEDIEKRLTGL